MQEKGQKNGDTHKKETGHDERAGCQFFHIDLTNGKKNKANPCVFQIFVVLLQAFYRYVDIIGIYIGVMPGVL